MPKTNPAARIACRNAWASIRRAKAIYGGNARDYLSEAMRLAWADLRTDPVMLCARQIIAENRARRAAVAPKPRASFTTAPGFMAAVAARKSRLGGAYRHAW
jgi:hypothetical protein